jgi:hypothetical protein
MNADQFSAVITRLDRIEGAIVGTIDGKPGLIGRVTGVEKTVDAHLEEHKQSDEGRRRSWRDLLVVPVITAVFGIATVLITERLSATKSPSTDPATPASTISPAAGRP